MWQRIQIDTGVVKVNYYGIYSVKEATSRISLIIFIGSAHCQTGNLLFKIAENIYMCIDKINHSQVIV